MWTDFSSSASSASAKLSFRTSLTGAGERAGINPVRMHFYGKYFLHFPFTDFLTA
jgi:hypothetical protein